MAKRNDGQMNLERAFSDHVESPTDIDPQLIFADTDLTNDQLFKKYVPSIFPNKVAKEIMALYPDLKCRKHRELFKFRDKSIIMTGVAGTGKTFAACMLALFGFRRKKEINWMYLSHAVIFTTVGDLTTKLRNLVIHENAVITETGRTAYADYIYELKRVRFLILDDLGTEKQTDFADDILDSIINTRYESGHFKHTIITTNLTIEELCTDRGHSRIFSRITDIGEIIEMTYVFRKKKININQFT